MKDKETLDNSRNNDDFAAYNRTIIKKIEDTQGLDKEIWVPSFKKMLGVTGIKEITSKKTVSITRFFWVNILKGFGEL